MFIRNTHEMYMVYIYCIYIYSKERFNTGLLFKHVLKPSSWKHLHFPKYAQTNKHVHTSTHINTYTHTHTLTHWAEV